MPLAGISIGDGWTDPLMQVRWPVRLLGLTALMQLTAYPDVFWSFGLADPKQTDVITSYIHNATQWIQSEDYMDAFLGGVVCASRAWAQCNRFACTRSFR